MKHLKCIAISIVFSLSIFGPTLPSRICSNGTLTWFPTIKEKGALLYKVTGKLKSLRGLKFEDHFRCGLLFVFTPNEEVAVIWLHCCGKIQLFVFVFPVSLSQYVMAITDLRY